jgi:hypothetical protein
MFNFTFFRTWKASHLRHKVGPHGFEFIRNYKAIHRDRVENAIKLVGAQYLHIADQAFDAFGNPIPNKIAVYAASPETSDLFFQHYQNVKHAEKARQPATA